MASSNVSMSTSCRQALVDKIAKLGAVNSRELRLLGLDYTKIPAHVLIAALWVYELDSVSRLFRNENVSSALAVKPLVLGNGDPAPRMRGDDPCACQKGKGTDYCSPHARG